MPLPGNMHPQSNAQRDIMKPITWGARTQVRLIMLGGIHDGQSSLYRFRNTGLDQTLCK
jgi:hypothetical protein